MTGVTHRGRRRERVGRRWTLADREQEGQEEEGEGANTQHSRSPSLARCARLSTPSYAVPAEQWQGKANYRGNDPIESRQHHDRTLLEARQAVLHEVGSAIVPVSFSRLESVALSPLGGARHSFWSGSGGRAFASAPSTCPREKRRHLPAAAKRKRNEFAKLSGAPLKKCFCDNFHFW